MTTPLFKPATRRAVKLKLAIQGPSGSGKTLGALALAAGLAHGGRVAVVDTENGSASLYADRFAFDTLELRPPYTSARYLEAVTAAAAAGYAVVVLDSLSHQWAGEGGILSRKEDKDAHGGNSFTNWAPFSKEHEGLKAGLLNAPIHVVATMRTKQDYVLESGEKGKQIPKKVGMAPIQREGMEYEFTAVWELQMDHLAFASKDRTGLFGSKAWDLAEPTVAARLLTWLESAAPADEETSRVELTPVTDAERKLVLEEAAKAGLTKGDFPAFYQEVTGRPWQALYQEDVKALLAECAKRIAKRREKVAAS